MTTTGTSDLPDVPEARGEGAGGGSYASVSCPTSTFCMAVENSGGDVVYDGSTWTAGGLDYPDSLVSVSCWASNACVAANELDSIYDYYEDGTRAVP